eukprot:1776761-Amphidinium_carterae.3
MESRLCVKDNSMSEFDMVAEFALTMRKMTAEREIGENTVIEEIEKEDNRNNDLIENEKDDKKDKICNRENEDNDEYDNNEEDMQTLNSYKMEERNNIDDGQDEYKVAFPNTVRRSLPTI